MNWIELDPGFLVAGVKLHSRGEAMMYRIVLLN